MKSPVQTKVGAIFIPVKDIKKAKEWYCDLLNIETPNEIIADHLFVIDLDYDLKVVLDSKIYEKRIIDDVPLFHFNTSNIETAYKYVQLKGIEVLTAIQHDHFFNIRDLDGNVLMICKC
ncbi:VOC family protein [Alkalibacillus haloalkaliphilus]|uniref:Glyoxalase/fosfomycin resistance/dioxygenase domain-containing protein n=1 Tax=Alkalibacillus haloalkaliphilus TaxID=94136 RepID=A0A511W6Y0_9BACI|nr:VOC family protein [Alkalibacillus haloalkaliphilus]GEN46068.1 hypothetical protein AHA02nite_18440 [Alkalibacillus haloalkaliphilus]